MRSTSRITKFSINTVKKLLIDAGNACAEYHDRNVRGLQCGFIEVDEIWSFVYCKERNKNHLKRRPVWAGHYYTWTGIDADSKLLVSWLCGSREAGYAYMLMEDLSDRIDSDRVQITSDGLASYPSAADAAFGSRLDFSRRVKPHVDADGVIHEEATSSVIGQPDLSRARTCFMERMNLTLRMQNRRYTRKTNGFRKNPERHGYQVALFVTYYNWCRIHETLKTTPAVAAGLAMQPHDMDWLVGLVEARDRPANRPRHYNTRHRQRPEQPEPPPDDDGSTVEAPVMIQEEEQAAAGTSL
jgi:transposase-like protein